MPVRTIITPANPILRQKAKKVTTFGPALKTLVDDMVDTMREAPGVGLAAPQVAVSQRVIVIEFAPEPEEGQEPEPPKLYRVINPEIVKASDEMVMGVEGCLSIPGYAGDVERHAAVSVKGFNLQGKPIKIKAEGWLARIFQHEIDHLDGVLLIDRAAKVWKMEGEAPRNTP
ncbi:MAG: peptide deformylase [Chloroflexi bacterium]|nr:peptide deformylase [Chloroflexota bacterium]